MSVSGVFSQPAPINSSTSKNRGIVLIAFFGSVFGGFDDCRLTRQEIPPSVLKEEDIGEPSIQRLVAETLPQLTPGGGLDRLSSHHDADVSGDGGAFNHSFEPL